MNCQDCNKLNCFDCAVELRGKLEQTKAENRTLKKSFEEFTPGGSEFSNDPGRCILWIKDRLSSLNEQVKGRKKAESELSTTKKALELACKYIREYSPGLICEPVRDMAYFLRQAAEIGGDK